MLREFVVKVDCNRPLLQDFDPVNPKTGFKVVLPVDGSAYSPGMVNACGFNANDIYAYENAASDSVAESILKRINTLPADDVNKDISLDDKISMCVPRGWSSPAEYLRYTEKVATLMYNRQRQAEASSADDSIQFESKDDPNVE